MSSATGAGGKCPFCGGEIESVVVSLGVKTAGPLAGASSVFHTCLACGYHAADSRDGLSQRSTIRASCKKALRRFVRAGELNGKKLLWWPEQRMEASGPTLVLIRPAVRRGRLIWIRGELAFANPPKRGGMPNINDIVTHRKEARVAEYSAFKEAFEATPTEHEAVAEITADRPKVRVIGSRRPEKS